MPSKPPSKRAPSGQKSKPASRQRSKAASKKPALPRAAGPGSKRAPSKKGPSRVAAPAAGLVDVDSLPAIPIRGLGKISDYAVEGRREDLGQPGHYAVLSWTPEDYDYETQTRPVSKLYIFATKDERDDFQEQLYDEAPNLYLQAFKFAKPVLIRSSQLRSHQ